MTLHDHKPLVTIKSVHADGDLALYTNGRNGHTIHLDLGGDIVTTSDTDLVPLAKAILNAVEPEALVENQKDAKPEPIKDGDWVLVAEDSPYNEHYRGKVLQVIEAEWSGSPDFVLLRSEEGKRGAVRTYWVTPASAPTPARDLAAEVDSLSVRADTFKVAIDALTTRVADLEPTDTEIRVGDTVRVYPEDWNMGGAWCDNEILTGKVTWVDEAKTVGSRYLVKVTPSRGSNAAREMSIYAYKVTKVAPRG